MVADRDKLLSERFRETLALHRSHQANVPAMRAQALAKTAPRVPARGAARCARRDGWPWRTTSTMQEQRAHALADIAPRLPPQEQITAIELALAIACGIDHPWRRAQALATLAQRFTKEQAANFSARQWQDTIRALAMRARGDCVVDLPSILPVIDAVGGEAAIQSLKRSIISVGLRWSNSKVRRQRFGYWADVHWQEAGPKH